MKKILFIAALALCFVACKNETPFDTQDPNDAPLILKPYNESGTGSFTYYLANPETPLVDSVIVTPSRYTTVNWYVDDSLVNTGLKIDMCFPGGVHDLVIEAVTTAGKRTERTGTIIVFGGEKELWHGPADLNWDAENVKVTKATMAAVPLGAKIRIYYSQLENQDYYALRVMTPWWGDETSLNDCLVPQKDMMGVPGPLVFEYDERCKGLVDTREAMCAVGNGLKIILIDYE